MLAENLFCHIHMLVVNIFFPKCLKKYSSHLAQTYIIHTGDVERYGDYLYLPLYMVPCL